MSSRPKDTTTDGGFARWMQAVDSETVNRLGLSIHDLADQPFRDYWESGLSPGEVVEQAMGDEGLEGWS